MDGKYVGDNKIKTFFALVRAIPFVFLIDLLINLMESSLLFWTHRNKNEGLFSNLTFSNEKWIFVELRKYQGLS